MVICLLKWQFLWECKLSFREGGQNARENVREKVMEERGKEEDKGKGKISKKGEEEK